MSIISNSKALDVILEHLDMCHSLTEQLVENGVLIEREKINPILKHIEINRDLFWFVIGKYLNLEKPNDVRDIFRCYLHTGDCLKHLQNNPTLNRAEALSREFHKLIDFIKE